MFKIEWGKILRCSSILLAGTVLKPKFNNRAVLNIASDNQPEPQGEEMKNNYQKAGLGAFLAAFLAATFSVNAVAQEQESVEEIIVTGSRLARSGYDTPTPVTVVGIEQIEADAPHNIADIVNQLPSVVGSSTPNSSNLSISSGGAGYNGINLRSLGRTRTLTLLNGRRLPGAANDNAVDVLSPARAWRVQGTIRRHRLRWWE